MKKTIIFLALAGIGSLQASAQLTRTGQAPNSSSIVVRSSDKSISSTPRISPPATPGPVDPDAGIFKFKEETHDYGTVPEGPLAEYDFEFRNTGKKPIIITEARGSCGCTVPIWPKDPILPKHKGVIHVAYNTAGRVGIISKDVFITSNAQQNPMKLHIMGTVKAKPAEPKPDVVPPPPPAGK